MISILEELFDQDILPHMTLSLDYVCVSTLDRFEIPSELQKITSYHDDPLTI
jgi:hypothetical protein